MAGNKKRLVTVAPHVVVPQSYGACGVVYLKDERGHNRIHEKIQLLGLLVEVNMLCPA